MGGKSQTYRTKDPILGYDDGAPAARDASGKGIWSRTFSFHDEPLGWLSHYRVSRRLNVINSSSGCKQIALFLCWEA